MVKSYDQNANIYIYSYRFVCSRTNVLKIIYSSNIYAKHTVNFFMFIFYVRHHEIWYNWFVLFFSILSFHRFFFQLAMTLKAFGQNGVHNGYSMSFSYRVLSILTSKIVKNVMIFTIMRYYI